MDIKITKMVTKGLTGKTKAFFTAAIGPIEINDVRLVEGQNGVFVGFPSKKFEHRTEGTKWVDIVRLAIDDSGKRTKTSDDIYNKILAAALEEYRRREGSEAGVTITTESTEESDDLPF